MASLDEQLRFVKNAYSRFQDSPAYTKIEEAHNNIDAEIREREGDPKASDRLVRLKLGVLGLAKKTTDKGQVFFAGTYKDVPKGLRKWMFLGFRECGLNVEAAKKLSESHLHVDAYDVSLDRLSGEKIAAAPKTMSGGDFRAVTHAFLRRYRDLRDNQSAASGYRPDILEGNLGVLESKYQDKETEYAAQVAKRKSADDLSEEEWANSPNNNGVPLRKYKHQQMADEKKLRAELDDLRLQVKNVRKELAARPPADLVAIVNAQFPDSR